MRVHHKPSRMTHLLSAIRPVVVLAALAGMPLPAVAEVLFPSLDQTLEGHPATTYLDLVQLIAPGARRDNGAYWVEELVPLRHIGEHDLDDDVPTGLAFDRIAVLPVRSDGQERIVLLLDLGPSSTRMEGFAVLALIDPAGDARLLDVANVAYDHATSFFDPAKLAAGPMQDIIVTTSRHSNSNQGYQATTIIDVRGDQFALVDTIYTLSDHDCGFERRQQPDISASDAGPSPSIIVTVTEVVVLTEPTCDGVTLPVAGQLEVSVAYRRDPATGSYATDSDALDQLAMETAERY